MLIKFIPRKTETESGGANEPSTIYFYLPQIFDTRHGKKLFVL